MSTRPRLGTLAIWAAILAGSLLAPTVSEAKKKTDRRRVTASEQLSFGVDMARRGLWNEALFRFHRAEQLEPGKPRVLNNLAVAYEAVGEFDEALEHYKKALEADPGNKDLRRNYARFVEFYQSFRPAGEPESDAQEPAEASDTKGP